MAVGQWEYDLGIEIALAEASSGATWTLQRFPGAVTRQFTFVDSPIAGLSGGSCQSRDWCMAVGARMSVRPNRSPAMPYRGRRHGVLVGGRLEGVGLATTPHAEGDREGKPASRLVL